MARCGISRGRRGRCTRDPGLTPSAAQYDAPQFYFTAAMIRAYTGFMSQRPLVGNALSMGTVVGLGDLTAQTIGGAPFDGERASITTAYGLAAGAPFRMWLTFLESIKKLQQPTMRNALIKVAINQCVYSPLFNSIYFAIAIARQAWKSPRQDKIATRSFVETWAAKCRADLLRTQLVANCWFFPANTLIFRFVDVQFRGPANAVAVAGFNVYLSLVGNRHAPKQGIGTAGTGVQERSR